MTDQHKQLTGDDAKWMRAMIRGLQARDLRSIWIEDAIKYVEEICARTKSSPQSQFGDPQAFARKLEFPLRPYQASPGHVWATFLGATRVHYTGIVAVFLGVAGLFPTLWGGMALRDGDPELAVPLGFFTAVLGVLAVVLTLVKLPTHFVLKHAFAFILGMMAVIIALVLFSVFTSVTLFTLPTPVMFGVGIAIGVVTLLMLVISAGKTRSDGESELSSQLVSTAVVLVILYGLMLWLPYSGSGTV